MIKKFTLPLILFLSVIVFSGCQFHTYQSGLMTQTNVTLSQNNFRYVKLAKGQTTFEYTSFFGMKWGDHEMDGPMMAAKRDLLENNPLKDGQALANMTYDLKRIDRLPFQIKQTWILTLTADIVEFR